MYTPGIQRARCTPLATSVLFIHTDKNFKLLELTSSLAHYESTGRRRDSALDRFVNVTKTLIEWPRLFALDAGRGRRRVSETLREIGMQAAARGSCACAECSPATCSQRASRAVLSALLGLCYCQWARCSVLVSRDHRYFIIPIAILRKKMFLVKVLLKINIKTL